MYVDSLLFFGLDLKENGFEGFLYSLWVEKDSSSKISHVNLQDVLTLRFMFQSALINRNMQVTSILKVLLKSWDVDISEHIR